MINGIKLVVLLTNQKDYEHSTLKLILVWWLPHLDSIPWPLYFIPADVCIPKFRSNSAQPRSSVKTCHYQAQLIKNLPNPFYSPQKSTSCVSFCLVAGLMQRRQYSWPFLRFFCFAVVGKRFCLLVLRFFRSLPFLTPIYLRPSSIVHITKETLA